jgi:hypothetical protein
VSFAEHLRGNPGLDLRFRFVTTADAGEERPAAPLMFTPGILLWEAIRTDQIEASKRVPTTESIANFLQVLQRPDSVRDAAWQSFIASTRDPSGFANLLLRFEWGLGEGGSTEVEAHVEQKLLRLGHAKNQADAKMRHDQLFVFIIRLLARRKAEVRKTLNLQDLRSCLASGVVNAGERRLFEELRSIRTLVLGKFAGVEESIASVKGDTQEIMRLLLASGKDQSGGTLRPVIDASAVVDSFRAASSALLEWPQETAGHWIERGELSTLENIITTKDHSCTALLGKPGCGKSALLARLGRRLQAAGTTLLALKTDQLPRKIESLAGLDQHLQLKTSLVDSIADIASRERVILLIDQLDALGGLMDQHTNRLSVVLHLVHRLKGLPNVHVIISCRAFDYRYDSRFASLAAEKVDLPEPTWEAVNALLKSLGITTATWPREMRELLRNPQHLNIFVQNFGADSTPHVFENYQSMLEVMFTNRVVNPYGPVTVEACEKIAAEMSDAEDLWIPRISLDKQYPREVDRLIASGMLQVSGRKIGFRHQTLFDYVRTRAFCTGTASLSDHVLARQDAVFVRSTLWASLHALRSSSARRFQSEFGRLWVEPKLPRHLRWLLISFLGQVSEPDDEEAQWLMPTLDDTQLRGKTLSAIVGNPGWFNRLQSRLPSLMTDPDETKVWQVVMVLQAALAFDRPAVIRAILRLWSEPDRDKLVLATLRDLSVWDDQTGAALEVITGRQPISPSYVVHLAGRAAKSVAGLGARVVAAALNAALQRALEAVDRIPPDTGEGGNDAAAAVDRLFGIRKRLEPIRKLVDSHDWYGLEEIVSLDPASFVKNVWPWFLRVAALLAEPENPRLVQYRAAGVELDDEIGRDSNLLRALNDAVRRFAELSPDAFLEFAESQVSSDLIVVHRLLASGFEPLARTKPDVVLGYLVADPRRLALGNYGDRHMETKRLISAAAKHLSPADLARLERLVIDSKSSTDQPGDEPEIRRERRRWNRQHRLRLLHAFPNDRLSGEARRLRDEEDIALPGTRDFDMRIHGGAVGSPVSTQQMAKAKNKDISKLFEQLAGGDRRPHRSEFLSLRGGIDEASQAFAAFAKDEPQRAIEIIQALKPETEVTPAAHALGPLSESAKIDPRSVVDLIHELVSRGFSSEEFRQSAAWALRRLAGRCEGLGDRTCEMLKSWIGPARGEERAETEMIDASKQPHSLLWSPSGLRTLPAGNYPALEALGSALWYRKPPDVDAWLAVLRDHLDTAEDLDVWRALADNLHLLGAASDRAAAVDFLNRLFQRYPGALASFEGTLFLARSDRWLPDEFVQKCLELVEQSDWPWKEQAIGELAMLRWATHPADQYCGRVVDRAIAPPSRVPVPSDLRRVGIAFACTHLWAEPEFRERSHIILAKLARAADGYLPGAIMDLFRITTNVPPDEKTEELLRIIARNPDLIRRGGGPHFLTDRLKELLADGFDARAVADVTRAIVLAGGSDVGDIRTVWAADAGDLIELAITLQRIKDTRALGLEIFEALMDAGAYEADQVLRELDRRPI